MLRFFFIFLCLTFSNCLAEPAAITLKEKIDQLLASAPRGVSVGILVEEVGSKRVIYRKNAERNFTPASNQKLITAIAGLLHLGKDYRFKTELLSSTNEINQNTLPGDLIIRFGGDPTLKVEQLQALLAELPKKGINRIQGDIIIDNRIFGDQGIGPGWMWDDLDSCFASPVTGSILNRNCVGFVVKPAAVPVQPLKIESRQQGRFIFIENNTHTQSTQKGCHITVKLEPKNKYVLDGCLALHSKPQGISVPLNDPNEYLVRVIRQLISIYNIPFSGKIIFSTGQVEKQILATHYSQPLSAIVKESIKESDNLLTDAIFKTLGASYYGKPSTWKKSTKAVKTILQKRTGIDLQDAVIADGSGLSRYNLITPEKLVALLRFAYKDPNISKVFYDTLPIAAIDGTLKNRMKQKMPAPHVHAKTGTMHGISALSGYIETKSKKTLIFSMIFNGISGKLRSYSNLEDRICTEIAEKA